MNSRKIVTVIMLFFVVVSLGFLGYRIASDDVPAEMHEPEGQTERTVSEQAGSDAVLKPDANVDVVYYFMTTQRCPSCMKIESYTKQAVDQNFSKELQDKELVWRMINVDDSSNRHFIKDYELYTKSVVLVKFRDGKQVEWKNLDRVWNLLNDETAFRQYITDEVKAFLQEV